MSAYDDVEAQIEALHVEAEELAAKVRGLDFGAERTRLLSQATSKIRQAARLRAQLGED